MDLHAEEYGEFIREVVRLIQIRADGTMAGTAPRHSTYDYYDRDAMLGGNLPILFVGALYSLMEEANRHPRWIGDPNRMLRELGPSYVADMLFEPIIMFDFLQDAIMMESSCSCGDCGGSLLTAMQDAVPELIERVEAQEQRTVERSS